MAEKIKTKYLGLDEVEKNKRFTLEKIYTKLKKSVNGNYYMSATIYCSDAGNNYGVNIPLEFTRGVDGVKNLVKEGVLTNVTFTEEKYTPIVFNNDELF